MIPEEIALKYIDLWHESDPVSDGRDLREFFVAGIEEALAERDKNWQEGNAVLRHERDVAKKALADYKNMMHDKGP